MLFIGQHLPFVFIQFIWSQSGFQGVSKSCSACSGTGKKKVKSSLPVRMLRPPSSPVRRRRRLWAQGGKIAGLPLRFWQQTLP